VGNRQRLGDAQFILKAVSVSRRSTLSNSSARQRSSASGPLPESRYVHSIADVI